MTKDSFIFYRSFFESILELENDDRLKIYDAICQLGLNQDETKLEGISKAIFTLIKPQLNANNRRYENGSKGGRPKTKTKPKSNLNESKSKANNNVNVNDNVNIKKEINKEKKFTKPSFEEVKNYCNRKEISINPEKFINYYESNGWKVGKNSMKDWKACVRNWEITAKTEHKSKNINQQNGVPL